MLHRQITLLLLFCFCTALVPSQEPEPERISEQDSVATAPEEIGVVFQDTVFSKQPRYMDPLAPSRAAFYSSVLPGLGQIYNKSYWKAPIVWGAIGGGIYMYSLNNDNYQRFRTAFKRRQAGFTDDEFWDINGDGIFPDLDNSRLENQQERFQQDRDLWLVATIALYALNIVEANVDAHLKQFNIDDDLGVEFQPFLDLNPITNEPNYGVAMVFKF